jgi:hypothetical protein
MVLGAGGLNVGPLSASEERGVSNPLKRGRNSWGFSSFPFGRTLQKRLKKGILGQGLKPKGK